MFPDTPNPNKPIILKCWFWSGTWRQGEIIEASAETQTAEIAPQGAYVTVTIPFSAIRNVALAHGFTGKIVQSFGSPKTIQKEYAAELPQFAEVSQCI